MDRSLDEILAERQKSKGGPRNSNHSHNNNRRGGGGGGGYSDNRRREPQRDYPRDGVRKSHRDESRNLDSEWVHDRYEDDGGRGRHGRGRRRDSPVHDEIRGTRIRIDNIHYELTEEDLEQLFERIGPVLKFDMLYDRAGRSEGTAFVTYESHQDARDAIREFDGANAAGQPIRLSIAPPGGAGGRSRNPFDTAVKPSRPLSERITMPSGRTRSLSPRRDFGGEASRKGIDRYVPRSRSRSPLPGGRRREGRRPGERRGRRGGGGDGRSGGGRGEVASGDGAAKRGSRPKKTQDELDAEMADYFGGGGGAGAGAGATAGDDGAAAPAAVAPAVSSTPAIGDDVDMIE